MFQMLKKSNYSEERKSSDMIIIKKSAFRRLISRFMALAIISAVVITSTGCKVGFRLGGNKRERAKREAVSEGVYRSKDINLDLSISSLSSAGIKCSKKYFVFAYTPNVSSNKQLSTNEQIVVCDNKDGKIVYSFDTNGYAMGYTFDKDDNLHYIVQNPGDDGSEVYLYGEKNTKGEDLNDQFNVSEFLNKNIKADYIMLNSFDCDGKNIYLSMDNDIIKTDTKFSNVSKYHSDTYLGGTVLGSDGKFYIGVTNDETYKIDVSALDFETGKLKLSFSVDEFIYPKTGFGDYLYVIDNNTGAFGYDKEGKKKTLINYLNSDINTSSGQINVSFIDNKYAIGLFTSYSDDANSVSIMKLSKTDGSANSKKIILSMGVLYSDDDIKNAIINFNKSSDKYRIQLIDYSQNQDEDVATALNNDITTGNAPDIIDFGYTDSSSYAEKGLLTDLNEYLDEDKDLNKDDFIPSVYETMMNGDKLYCISPAFTVSSLVSSSKVVGDLENWTYDDYYKNAKEMSKKGQITTYYSKSELFEGVLDNCLSDFIDWDTKKCRFSSSDFRHLLEVANTGVESMEGIDAEKRADEALRKNELLYTSFNGDPTSIRTTNVLYGGNAKYIGFPSLDGKGTAVSFSNRISIYSRCYAKDGAWEFIKYLFTPEYQGRMDSIIPVRQDSFEDYLKEYTCTKEYVNDYGKKVTPLDGSYAVGSIEVGMTPLSEEEIDVYRNIVNSAGKTSTLNKKVSDIISEESEKFFKGEKSIDEAIDMIQNRISTYISETS